MPTFKNMKDLEKHLNKQIQSALKNEVAEKVKDVMQMKVKTEVYDAYTSYSKHPDAYDRRYEDGGLADRSNMKEKMINDNTLSVENITKGRDSGKRIDGLIEYGHDNGYGQYDYYPAWNSEGDFRKSRPFIDETRLSLKNGEAEKALKEGLRKQGLDVI